MSHKTWLLGGFLLLMGVALASPLAAQQRRPDLSGTYSFATITPLQRPDGLAGKPTLSDEEASSFEQSENTRQNRDLFDPEKGQPSAGYQPRAQGGVLSYNEFWYERGSKLTKDRRTSLIVDPPDGKIPFTPEAQQRVAAMRRWSDSGMGDSYEDRPVADRCLQGFNSGPPMTPGQYNNNVQIVQGPGYVAIISEMVHNARIIPTDGSPHLKIRRWSGDSRGHWDGDTFVVETMNFRRETSLQGSTAGTRVVERFTRIDAETLRYEFTVTDPSSYTRPWTAMVPLVKMKEPLLEYGCHEGNYALPNILTGARAQEKTPAPGVTP